MPRIPKARRHPGKPAACVTSDNDGIDHTMNDLLFLHIHNGADGNAPIAWSKLTPLVEAMESLATEGAKILAQAYLRRPIMEPPSAGKRAQLLLAGPPQRGSIIVPFALDLPATFNIAGLLPMAVGGIAPQSNALSDYLGGLADLAALAVFVRDVLFGENGLIARRSDQVQAPDVPTLESRAIEGAAFHLTTLTPQIDQLMRTAEATGCERMDVQVNDQAKISLVMANRRRRASLLALAPKPTWPPSNPPLPGYYFDPTQPGALRRSSNQTLMVQYDGRPLDAILLQHQSPAAQQLIVAVWSARMPVPAEGELVEVQGHVIERTELVALDDVPTEFEAATHIFLVTAARSSWQ